MQCRSCGTELQPGAVACLSCGAPATSAPSDFASYESSFDTVPYIPYTPFVETSSASSSQQTPPHPQPDTNPSLSTGPQFYMEAPPPTQQQRGGPSAGMVALLIILAFLVAAAGSGLTYYMIAIRPSQRQAQATAVAPTILTTQTPANAQQTTPITTTDPQDLYRQATSGTPALTDSLSPLNPNQWYPTGSLGSCTFTGNALQASASPAGSTNTQAICEARSTSFDNFAYQVQATILQGDSYGLIFRYDHQVPRLYLFLIGSDGLYLLGLLQVNGSGQNNLKLLAGANSSAINTGLNQSNLLTVIARGSTIYLYVNQQYLTSVSDSTSSVGEIGVFGENTAGGLVDVAFSEIQVWRL